MVPFRLTCLGPPELHGPDGDPIRFRTKKHLALLIYLALEPSIPHRRDRVATLLWPHTDLTESRHSLATALSILRGYLGAEAFDARRDTLRLLPGKVITDTVALDGTEFETRNLDIPGPFLEEFEIPDTPDFDLWREGKNADLIPKIHRVLGAQIDFCRRRGEARRVEALGNRLYRIDDVAEEATRALIEARAMSGDRIGAIRAFDRWGHRLHDEMGAAPSLLVEKMAERLRRRGWERPPIAIPAPEQVNRRAHFVGRGDEFESCYQAFEQARQARPQHVLVRGESGIGKTTLVERFASAMALEGACVARVQCYELERELPFGTVVGLVNHLIDLPGASATAPDQLAELAELVPKIRQKYPVLPAPKQSGAGENARLLFTEGVMALMAAVADEQPVIVVVDDIHLADFTSLAVLHLILRRVESLALMVALTSSSSLENESPNARRFVENADSIRLAQVELGALSDEESTEVLDLLLESPVDPGPTIRRALLRTAQGNPMVLALLVDDWRRRGDDCLALSIGAMTATAQSPAKETVRRVVEGMLVALDAEAMSVVELAAILGQRLNDLSLYALIDLPVSRTMMAMARLTSQRIFRDAGSHLEFANELIRSQCYHAMAAPLRRMLHGLVADHLLTQDGLEEPIPGLELAWHLVRADRPVEAIPHLLAGGRESIQRGAPHEADLAFSTGLPALSGKSRRTALLLLAEARQELGRWRESLEILDGTLEPFDEAEASSKRVMQIVAHRWLGLLTPTAVDENTDELLSIVAGSAEIDARVRALAAVPYLLTQSRDTSRYKLLGEAANRLSFENMSEYQRIHVFLVKAWYASETGDQETALTYLDHSQVLVERTGAGSSVALRVFIGAATVRLVRGHYKEALPILEHAQARAKQSDNVLHSCIAAAALATVNGRLGNYNAQLAWSEKALRLVSTTDWIMAALSATYEKALALVFLERYDSAKETILQLEQRQSQGNCPSWVIQVVGLFSADILSLSGDSRLALQFARRATTGENSRLHLADFLGPFVRWKALIAARESNAVDCISELQEFQTNGHRYHSKDNAELLAALCFLHSHAGAKPTAALNAELESRLSELPDSITVLLRRLGMLRFLVARPN